MFEINKKEFGAFVSQQRRQKGLTQKQLAEKLYVSDKAVSKWETGASIPDTTLLIPLAKELGVTVTELLMCRRMEQNDRMDAGQVETVVKTAIHYTEEKPVRGYADRSSLKWIYIYLACLLACGAGVCLNALWGHLGIFFSGIWFTYNILGVVFGMYFVFFVRIKLPKFYDENRIHGVFDGIVRMHIPGVVFNNCNWPYIVRFGRIWACAATALPPFLNIMLCQIAANSLTLQQQKTLALSINWIFLASMFVPLYIIARKYE